jgi:hypothetical protein
MSVVTAEKVESGVMVMKDGKAWGLVYKDGQSTAYGWMDPVDAPIRDPRFCKEPTDVTYANSCYWSDLKTARLVKVTRTIATMVVIED